MSTEVRLAFKLAAHSDHKPLGHIALLMKDGLPTLQLDVPFPMGGETCDYTYLKEALDGALRHPELTVRWNALADLPPVSPATPSNDEPALSDTPAVCNTAFVMGAIDQALSLLAGKTYIEETHREQLSAAYRGMKPAP